MFVHRYWILDVMTDRKMLVDVLLCLRSVNDNLLETDVDGSRLKTAVGVNLLLEPISVPLSTQSPKSLHVCVSVCRQC